VVALTLGGAGAGTGVMLLPLDGGLVDGLKLLGQLLESNG